MDFELIKNILILPGGLIALLTFLLSYLEYQEQGKQKRVNLYLQMERRLFNNDNFQEIRLHPQKGEPEITKIERKMRSDSSPSQFLEFLYRPAFKKLSEAIIFPFFI